MEFMAKLLEFIICELVKPNEVLVSKPVLIVPMPCAAVLPEVSVSQ